MLQCQISNLNYLYFSEQSSPSNFVFSPYSIHSIFSQLLFGAQGDTKTQLQVLLSLTPTDRTINQYRSLSSNLNSGSAQLLIANELALAQGFKPKPSYIQTLGNNYKIAEYDFANDRANSVKKVMTNDLEQKFLIHNSHFRSMIMSVKILEDLLKIFFLSKMWMNLLK